MKTSTEELIAEGYAARRMGQPGNALTAFTEAVIAADADPSGRAQALTGVGQIERDLGNLEAAAKHYQSAVDLLRGLNEPLRLAHTIRHVGDILHDQGHLDAAVPCYEEALAVYRSHDATAPLDLGNTLRGYALVEQGRGNNAAASKLWQEARDLYQFVGVDAGIREADRRLAALQVA
jgi:tetratricopeptide (TPR) repeat protein